MTRAVLVAGCVALAMATTGQGACSSEPTREPEPTNRQQRLDALERAEREEDRVRDDYRARQGPTERDAEEGDCATGYSPCLPVRADLDCAEIDDDKKPISVTGDDPYGLDRDGDGIGCEAG